MNQRSIEALSLLKEAIDLDPRSKRLSELEERINSSEEVRLASGKMKDALEEYNECLRYYDSSSKQAKDKQKALAEAKLSLDLLEEVKEYNEAYSASRKMLEEINDILFSCFESKHGCGK